MGQLIDGVWNVDNPRPKSGDGAFKRADTQIRNWVTPDGAPGPSGEGGFKAEPGRYHLYVSLACPWAHRTIIFRNLKGLRELIGVSVVEPKMLERGWEFNETWPDHVNGFDHYFQVYQKAVPGYTGRASVPGLWDRKRETLVSNESSEIIRMFNSAFNGVGANDLDFCPKALRREIDAINEPIYRTVNNGVYRCGFARKQAAYDQAFSELFTTLDMVEERLSRQRFLVGNRLTEADIRLFTTLIRFDAVYYGHFKCNLRRIADYPNLSNYLRDLYQVPGIGATVDIDHAKLHYYYSHESINPTRIVPVGPALDFDAAHDRDRFPSDGPVLQAA